MEHGTRLKERKEIVVRGRSLFKVNKHIHESSRKLHMNHIPDTKILIRKSRLKRTSLFEKIGGNGGESSSSANRNAQVLHGIF